MSVGLEALRVFRAKGDLGMREKYPNIYTEDVNKKCDFSPNKEYIVYPTTDQLSNLSENSPWYCFTLLPKKTVTGDPSLTTALYLMQFMNWAVYYYNDLKTAYDRIKDPKQAELSEAHSTVETIAIMIHSITGREYTQEEMRELAKKTFKKNNFIMKPPYFLKLVRFFARAWYEERFYASDNAVAPVKFAHYISCYIEYCINTNLKTNRTFNPKDENKKKEVALLFDKEKNNENLSYVYNGFSIELEKYLNPDSIPDKKHTYNISISQHGCKHSFYLFARLHQHQYKSSII